MDEDIEQELSAALTERARQFSAHQDAWERHRRAVATRSRTPRRRPRGSAPARPSRALPWAAAAAVVAAAAVGVIFSFHVPETAINANPQPSSNVVTTAPLAPCPVVAYTGSPSTPIPSARTGASAPAAAGLFAPPSSVTLPTTLKPSTTGHPSTIDSSARADVAVTTTTTHLESESTPALPPDLSWFSTAKSRQLSSAFRAALPAGVAIYANGQPASLPFGQTGGSAPGSSVVHSTMTASAELRSQHGAGDLVITLSQAFAPTPSCLDTGNSQTGERVTYLDGTIIDQAQGVTDTHSFLTVFVYRHDGTNVRADLFQPLTAKVLTLQQLANTASAPGFDISTPPSAADSTTEPLIPTNLTFASGGGQSPAPSEVTTR